MLVGFFGLLRTGEILSVTKAHVAITSPKGPAVLSLGLTKGGKRQGAAESITLYVEDVCRRLYQWKYHQSGGRKMALKSHQWRKQFADTLTALKFDQFDFRPYSLRRGGATYFFKQHQSFDQLLNQGRWQTVKTARLYVNEGLAVLAELTLPWNPFSRNLRAQYLRSFTTALPKLDPAPKVQNRGTWNRQKQHRKKPSKKKSTGVLLGVGLSVLGMAGPQAAHITLWLGLFSGLAELPRGVGFVNPSL